MVGHGRVGLRDIEGLDGGTWKGGMVLHGRVERSDMEGCEGRT